MYYIPYRELGGSSTVIPIFNSNGRLRSKKGGTGDEVATMDDIQGGFKTFEGVTTNSLTISSSVPFNFNSKNLLAPNTTLSPILLENGIKTLFGNQSIVGTGNIDLYKHHVFINFTSGDSNNVFFDFVSSKNIVCDSLTDLKTVLGNTFTIQAYGTLALFQEGITTNYFIPLLLTETYLQAFYIENSGSLSLHTITLASNPFTLTDTVTTI